MTSFPFPATTATSHASSSPPPLLVREAHLVFLLRAPDAELRDAEILRHGARDHLDGLGRCRVGSLVHDLTGDLPADAGELALERPDPRLTRVVVDDRADRILGDRQRHGLETAVLHLARYEVLHGDV